ncbi:hypothetical protein MKJ04_16730, partial [Pontibacter sp. E15-1]|nr:hypothetical protein [Pontibacter sp. E15-1]
GDHVLLPPVYLLVAVHARLLAYFDQQVVGQKTQQRQDADCFRSVFRLDAKVLYRLYLINNGIITNGKGTLANKNWPHKIPQRKVFHEFKPENLLAPNA